MNDMSYIVSDNIVTTLGLYARKSTLPHEHGFAAQSIARRISGFEGRGFETCSLLFQYDIIIHPLSHVAQTMSIKEK